MAILTSLYTGISGINANGAALSVIGDNIANMNTTGFKASRANFADILSASFGGSSASQIGRGAYLSSISQQFAQGSFETTANGLDMAIDGRGFFTLRASDGTVYYSRAGSMQLDNDGYIVNPEGLRLQGYQYDVNGSSTGVIGDLNIASLSSAPNPTTEIELTANLDSRSEGDRVVIYDGSGTFSANNTIVVNGSTVTLTGSADGTSYSGAALASHLQTQLNSLLGANATSVSFDSTTQRFTITNNSASAITISWDNAGTTAAAALGFDATASTLTASGGTDTSDNAAPLYKAPFDVDDPSSTSDFSSSITVYDSLGNAHQVTNYFRKAVESGTGNTWEWISVIPGSESTTGVNTIAARGTITFNTSGAYSSSTTTVTPDFDFVGGAAQDQSITLDLANLTQYGTNSATIYQNQDGYGAGSIQNISINQEGIITGVFTNGQTRSVGQVALASFPAPEGLTKQGGNLFSESYDSGPPVIGAPGASGNGTILASTLELSNVDLANEFVNMISAQRGFQANSRVISATDEILNELVNIRR